MAKGVAVFFVFLAELVFLVRNFPASAASLTVCASGCNYTSIQGAVDVAAVGSDILVRNGSYSGFTVGKRLIITGENIDTNDPRNNGATINGQIVVTGTYAYNLGPEIRGFRIIGGLDPVIIQNSTMTLRNSYVKGTSGDGISINRGAGIFQGNRVEMGGDDGIDVDSQSGNVIIEGNYILFSGQDGIEIRQQPVTLASRVSLWIRGNRIEASGEDGVQIMDYNNFTNRHYVVERNLFLNNSKAAIGLNLDQNTNQSYEAAPMPEPLYAVNNTFVGNDAGISGGANLVALNNIFSQQNSFDLKNVGGRSQVKYSLFTNVPHLVGSNNLDNSTTFTGNPLLDANYALGAGSPAIDKGIASYQHTYSYDGSGGGSAQTHTEYVISLNSSQYTGAAPDLGWKERGLIGPVSTNTPTPIGQVATSTPTPIPGIPTATRTPTPRSGTPTPTSQPGMCTFWRGYNAGSYPTLIPPTSIPTPGGSIPTATRTPTPRATATTSPTPTSGGSTPTVPPSGQVQGIWTSPSELAGKPMSGSAWDSVNSKANSPCGTPDILNQDDNADVCYMAKGLVFARTNNETLRTDVRNAVKKVITITGGTTYVNLAGICRNLIAYVIAADLVRLPANEDLAFRNYLREVRSRTIDGKTVIQQSEDRPNNIGTHCTATRLAIATYLRDEAEISRAAKVFKGWLGDRSSYSGFTYGDLSWQCNPSQPVGINPKGCTRNGHNIDGVLPDDQRRGGSFTWPPPKENYVWEALQGAHATAVILSRQGYDVWNWQDRAMLRALEWLHTPHFQGGSSYPAQADDTWQPHIGNFFYARSFPAPVPSNPGKNVGWTDFTHKR